MQVPHVHHRFRKDCFYYGDSCFVKYDEVPEREFLIWALNDAIANNDPIRAVRMSGRLWDMDFGYGSWGS